MESPRAYPRATRVREVRALGWVEGLGGYTVDMRAQREAISGAVTPSVPHPVHVTPRGMENGWLRVDVELDGVVTLHDTTSSVPVRGVVSLEMARDVGDLYTPAIRDAASAPACHSVRATLGGPLRGEMTLDYHVLDADGRDAGTVHVALQLDADLPVLRVSVAGDLSARDARLRILFATGMPGARTLADAAFQPVERAPIEVDPADAAMEAVVRTAPLHRWVSRYAPDRGATIFSDGLAEYESLDDGDIAVTLVRSVGVLSRHDVPERPGHAGWPVDTPAAQCTGPFSAAFGVALHAADSDDTRDLVERLADDVLLPMTGETLRSNVDAPHAAGGVELVGDGLAFSAMLPAHDQGWVVLRCVNRRDAVVQGRWLLGRQISEAHRARLDETRVVALPVSGSALAFEARPREIVTIVARYADG